MVGLDGPWIGPPKESCVRWESPFSHGKGHIFFIVVVVVVSSHWIIDHWAYVHQWLIDWTKQQQVELVGSVGHWTVFCDNTRISIHWCFKCRRDVACAVTGITLCIQLFNFTCVRSGSRRVCSIRSRSRSVSAISLSCRPICVTFISSFKSAA